MSAVLVDVSELLAAPVRTGIQRVVRSLLRHWPAAGQVRLCRFVPGRGLVEVPDAVLPWLTDATEAARLASPDTLAQAIGALLDDAAPAIPPEPPILVPELFFDAARCAAHRALLAADPGRVRFLLHDLIPWLHPELIGVRGVAHLMPYLTLLRDARMVAFTSQAVRHEFATRIRRIGLPEGDARQAAALARVGPVVPLGADGPPIPRQQFSAARRTYLCVGSVDGRKNQAAVAAAFRQLWQAGSDARLIVVGRVFAQMEDGADARALRDLASDPRFTHLVDIDDTALAALYGQARATIFASHREGHGLPPIEGLRAGVPAIVTAATPSIADLPPAGQIRLEQPTAAAIAAAVTLLETDDGAARLWAAAATQTPPDWSSTAAALANWMSGDAR